MLTDDLSDYESSDDEIERSLKEACGNEEESSCDDSHQTAGNAVTKLARRRKNGNKYRKTISIKEQWSDFTSRNSSENNL